MLIPLLFMGDVIGRLFHEFAITLPSPSSSRGGVPDARAYALRAAHPHRAAAQRALISGRSAPSTPSSPATAGAAMVLRHQPLTLFVAVATLGLTVALYHPHTEGLLPGAGHRHDLGRLAGVAKASASRRCRPCKQKLADVIWKDAAVEERQLLHRRRRQQSRP